MDLLSCGRSVLYQITGFRPISVIFLTLPSRTATIDRIGYREDAAQTETVSEGYRAFMGGFEGFASGLFRLLEGEAGLRESIDHLEISFYSRIAERRGVPCSRKGAVIWRQCC